jgi:transcriptional regulator with XRE-family HTH domain
MLSGRERLKDWIDRSKLNQREASEILDCHEVVLSQWLSGVRIPGLANALKIEQVSGISAESWLLTGLSSDGDEEPVSTSKRKITRR